MLKEESSSEFKEAAGANQGASRQGASAKSDAKAFVNARETSPLPDQVARGLAPAGQLLEVCPVCDTVIDVTDLAPLSEVDCPQCGQVLHAHRQFHNYELVELLGEGGMGSVFKAIDRTLNRNVALKILKKECSANEEERVRLEEEARITASINHPHVVKVFSFGEDHGQFYLAMELAEKGSLDNLMGIQQRLAEAQVLQIGIQIAEGLDAALERKLIHRDIKPGNILFSDAQTAKLVDFGLATVMDETAQARGEIWGTPYYIAPEKLDHQPEDFRSDIYSLGGTLFHALAGRPPYDAETASTVALKQLMSQPVSLQTFAPDVSSETAYVINRMLAKNPEERYSSYPELVGHLSFARNKLLERSAQSRKPKERVVIETQASKNLSGLLTLSLVSILAAACLMTYLFREKIFGPGALDTTPPAASSKEQLSQEFINAVRLLGSGKTEKALAEFDRLASLAGNIQPLKNWIRMNGGLAALVAGEGKEAAKRFSAIVKDDTYSTEEADRLLASFFVEASKQLAKPTTPIPSSIITLYSNTNFEAFGLLCFAFHNWEIGTLEACPIFSFFNDAKLPQSDAWIEELKPLAANFSFDCNLLAEIEKDLAAVEDPAAAQALAERARTARQSLRTGARATARLDSIQRQLIAKGANP